MFNNVPLIKSRRVRSTPFSRCVEAAGVSGYTVYNHMLLPTGFVSPEEDYWHLCEHVQVWDVSGERQVELRGSDAVKLAQLMTPRDLSKLALLQGKYAPICNADGYILNDPIVIKLSEDRVWLSIADSDVKFFAQGLALGYGLDVTVHEPDIFPLAVQGPKAEELTARLFGESVRSIRFFRGEMLSFAGREMYVARSGWSKQGGFEIYLNDPSLAEPMWNALFELGADLNVRAGCPNGVERLESGLLSFGNDMDEFDTPFECGLDRFLDLAADIESLSLPALCVKASQRTRKLVGLAFEAVPNLQGLDNFVGGFDIVSDDQVIGEIRSHAWSFRYRKYLAIAMLPLDYLQQNSQITIGGQSSFFHSIPFDEEQLAARQC